MSLQQLHIRLTKRSALWGAAAACSPQGTERYFDARDGV